MHQAPRVWLWCIAAGPAIDLIFTGDVWDCQGLDKTVLATHPLWTHTSLVLYPQSRQQAQAQQAVFPLSDIFTPVPWHAKKSPVSFPILIVFSLQMVLPHTPPAKVLHLCRKKHICSSTHSVLTQASLVPQWTVILHRFRLEGWFVVCPRDSKHHLLGTLHAALFEPPFGSVKAEKSLELFYPSWHICSSNLMANHCSAAWLKIACTETQPFHVTVTPVFFPIW